VGSTCLSEPLLDLRCSTLWFRLSSTDCTFQLHHRYTQACNVMCGRNVMHWTQAVWKVPLDGDVVVLMSVRMQACQVTVQELRRINPDMPTSLQCGDCIALPKPCQPRLYCTRRGDSWASIAGFLHTPPGKLRLHNADALVRLRLIFTSHHQRMRHFVSSCSECWSQKPAPRKACVAAGVEAWKLHACQPHQLIYTAGRAVD
jgi:hypothetical protein